jgi:hypothetical protein
MYDHQEMMFTESIFDESRRFISIVSLPILSKTSSVASDGLSVLSVVDKKPYHISTIFGTIYISLNVSPNSKIVFALSSCECGSVRVPKLI